MNQIAYKAEDLVKLMDSMRIVGSHITKDCCEIIYNNKGIASADLVNKKINIPRISEPTHEELNKLRTFVYHEAGHIRFTKIDVDKQPKNNIFKIYNALEDIRMEKLVSKDFEGCKDVLQWACDYFNKTNGLKLSSKEVTSPLWESLCAMMFVVQNRNPSWTLSNKAQWYFDTAFSTFQEVENTQCAEDCVNLAHKIWDLLKEELEKKNEKENPKEGNESKKDSDSEKEEQEYENFDSDKETKNKEIRKDDTIFNAEEELSADLEKGVDFLDELKKELKELTENKTSNSEFYTSITDNDKFVVPSVNYSDFSEFNVMKKEVSSSILGLTRNLDQTLRFLSKSKKNYFLEDGILDKTRLVSIAKSHDKNIFYSIKKGIALNSSVEIVLDQSGSLSGVIPQLKLLTIALGESLNAIHCPFEIFGATTTGQMLPLNGFTRTQPIVYNIYKIFNEQWSLVKNRVNKINASCNHIDGEVISFVGDRLLQRKEGRKIILSLSDGQPCGGQNKDFELGDNLKKVCGNLRKKGVEIYSFGIKTEQPSLYYGKENFLYLDDVSKMSEAFFKKLSQIIMQGRFKN